MIMKTRESPHHRVIVMIMKAADHPYLCLPSGHRPGIELARRASGGQRRDRPAARFAAWTRARGRIMAPTRTCDDGGHP